jgi:hypothetical protein
MAGGGELGLGRLVEFRWEKKAWLGFMGMDDLAFYTYGIWMYGYIGFCSGYLVRNWGI